MEKQLFGRFLLGAGLGGLVGTGVLALISLTLSGPFPQQRSAGPVTTREAGLDSSATDPGLAGTGAATPGETGSTPEATVTATAATEPPGAQPAEETATGEAAGNATESSGDTAVTAPQIAGIPEESASADMTAALEAPSHEAPAVPAPEEGASPDLASAPDLIELPALAPDQASDPALAAALEAAFGAGDTPSGSLPDQPAELAVSASDVTPVTPATPEPAPQVAGVPEAPDAGTTPPAALAGLPETPAAPRDEIAGAEPGTSAPTATATLSRPADPAEDAAPVLTLAPEPPPLTLEEELMLAQMAADQALEDSKPSPNAPAVPAGDEFVIVEDLAPEAAEELVPEAGVPAEAATLAVEAEPAAPVADQPAADQPKALPGSGTEADGSDPEPGSAPQDIATDAQTAEAVQVPEGSEVAPAPDAAPAKMITLDENSSRPGTAAPPRETGDGSNRLPRIGDAPQEAGAEDLQPGSDQPRILYARAFENPADKPRFAVILLDDGAADLERAALADLPFAVSFAIDPQLPNAGEIAALYRAAGQEVIMVASGLPKGAAASDVAVAFEAMARVLPEAVATMDAPGRSFQADRPLASLVVPEIAGQGRGLITWNIGLNAADQVAKREDVPAAVIFRDLDAEGEDAPVIRRYLDRAAFKAAQDGGVTVFGRARHAATVTALLEWAVEGRAASVELAPITAMLDID